MSVKYIKNDMVSMKWDAEGFYESKTDGFIAAVHIYDTPNGRLAVTFKDNKAFIVLDTETDQPLDRASLYRLVREEFMEGTPIEDYYQDEYVLLGTLTGVESEPAEYYGLDLSDQEDLLARMRDLSGYWVTFEEEMA